VKKRSTDMFWVHLRRMVARQPRRWVNPRFLCLLDKREVHELPALFGYFQHMVRDSECLDVRSNLFKSPPGVERAVRLLDSADGVHDLDEL